MMELLSTPGLKLNGGEISSSGTNSGLSVVVLVTVENYCQSYHLGYSSHNPQNKKILQGVNIYNDNREREHPISFDHHFNALVKRKIHDIQLFTHDKR
jgi:hypothetical protein